MAQVRRTWLGVKNIKALAKQYELLAKDLEKHTQGALDFATEKTFQRYQASLPDSLRKSADMEPPKKSGNYYRTRIKNTDERAIYVEYGTGLNGQDHPYPADGPQPEGSLPYYGYNTGPHSSQEEHYASGLIVPYGQWIPPGDMPYTDPKTGKKHIFTCGQKAQAPMYLTVQDVKKNMPTWVRTSFAQHGIQLKEK